MDLLEGLDRAAGCALLAGVIMPSAGHLPPAPAQAYRRSFNGSSSHGPPPRPVISTVMEHHLWEAYHCSAHSLLIVGDV